MIKRPEKIKVGYLDYAINYVGDDWVLHSGRDAEISYVKNEITIAKTLSPPKIASVFIHEITHALTTHYDRLGEDPIPRETVAEWIGEGLIMVWRDNPEAFKWLQELLENNDQGSISLSA